MSGVTIPKMRCPYSNCEFEWLPRVASPKKCPRCGRYLDRENKKSRRLPKIAKSIVIDEGTEGQDRENYLDTQDRENYVLDLELLELGEKEDLINVGT